MQLTSQGTSTDIDISMENIPHQYRFSLSIYVYGYRYGIPHRVVSLKCCFVLNGNFTQSNHSLSVNCFMAWRLNGVYRVVHLNPRTIAEAYPSTIMHFHSSLQLRDIELEWAGWCYLSYGQLSNRCAEGRVFSKRLRTPRSPDLTSRDTSVCIS
jgi:hypothetical protein